MSRTNQQTFVLFAICAMLAGCGKHDQQQNPGPFVLKFVEAKEAQAHEIVTNQNLAMPRKAWELFGALRRGDRDKATNLFANLETERHALPTPPNTFTEIRDWGEKQLERAGIYERKSAALVTEAWQPLVEAYWAAEFFRGSHDGTLLDLVNEITRTVPKGALYFGGTGGGRFGVSAAMDSHSAGNPFFVCTQNQLVDGGYRDYLATMFALQVNFPDSTEYNQIFLDHSRTIQKRVADGTLSTNQLGMVQVLELNVKFMEAIVAKNPVRESYIELSHCLTPVYHKLKPAGPIFQLCYDPPRKLPTETLKAHADYWSEFCKARLGVAFDLYGCVTQACDFVESRIVKQDLLGFAGDRAFIQNEHAQDWASSMRYWAADWYWWYLSQPYTQPKSVEGYQELVLAFAQAFALSPRHHPAVNQFVQFLEIQNRHEQARRVLILALALTPSDPDLVSQLREIESRAQ